MRKYLLVILIIIGMFAGVYVAYFNKGIRPLNTVSINQKIARREQDKSLNDAFSLLKTRRDQEALAFAVKIAPDFATANARLAQAYKKKGDLEKYNFYLQRAKELNPDNEVLRGAL